MAIDLINRSRGRIDQALHGYDGGHRLISASTKLDAESASTMLVMSDLAPSGWFGVSGWLTAYPLPKAERYVLARTWPAPEMPRPGCVWTHSLIIDYSLLASSSSLWPLANLFLRPWDNLEIYKSALPEPAERAPMRIPPRLYEPAREALIGLYDDTRASLITMNSAADCDALLLALWEQQWPRLRRRVRWTTVETRLSPELPPFDIVAASSKTVGRRPPKSAVRQGWVVAAMADLRAGGGLFRDGVRRFAIDVVSGRRAFSLVASAWLIARRRPKNVDDARVLMSLMDARLAKGEGVVARQAVVAALVGTGPDLDATTLRAALGMLDLLSAQDLHKVAWACWRLDRKAFWKTLVQTDVGLEAQHTILLGLSVGELVEGLTSAPTELNRVLELRSDLLEDEIFWREGAGLRKRAIATVRRSPALTRQALASAFASEDASLAGEILAGQPTDMMFEIYAAWERGHGSASAPPPRFQTEWLEVAARDAEATLRYLSNEFRLRPSLVALARIVGPSAIQPLKDRPDPWVKGWQTCAGKPVLGDEEYIALFFLIRSCAYMASDRAESFALAAELTLRNCENGLQDPDAIALALSFDLIGRPSMITSVRERAVRAVAKLAVYGRVPVAVFVARAPARYVDTFLDQLRWEDGGRFVAREAWAEVERLGASKKRLKLLEKAAW